MMYDDWNGIGNVFNELIDNPQFINSVLLIFLGIVSDKNSFFNAVVCSCVCKLSDNKFNAMLYIKNLPMKASYMQWHFSTQLNI